MFESTAVRPAARELRVNIRIAPFALDRRHWIQTGRQCERIHVIHFALGRRIEDALSLVQDIGARFAEPSSFNVLRRTTGVPTYKMAGSLRTCMAHTLFLDRAPGAASHVNLALPARVRRPFSDVQRDSALGLRQRAGQLRCGRPRARRAREPARRSCARRTAPTSSARAKHSRSASPRTYAYVVRARSALAADRSHGRSQDSGHGGADRGGCDEARGARDNRALMVRPLSSKTRRVSSSGRRAVAQDARSRYAKLE